MNTMLSNTELRQLLDYDPNTGHLTWIKKINKGTVLKSRAGTKQADGYRSVKLYGRKYLEHRLIWCWVHGDYPSQHLDHINHIRDDNRIINLREVTISENARNRLTRNSRTGEKGIWYCRRRKRYIAEIVLNGKKIYQASFEDPDEAIKQRKLKEIELGLANPNEN
jgi:hypothetical protein